MEHKKADLEHTRRPAMEAAETWPLMPVGTPLECVKVNPDGERVARYSGVVIEAGAPAPWIAVEARWTMREIALSGLRFVPGDTLHEFFSPRHPFNVFSIFAPDGKLRGWYANVTYPTVVEEEGGRYTLLWHDLYLDVIVLPDGSTAVLDDDELDAAGIARSAPRLHDQIVTAKDELVRLAAARLFPFHES